LRVHDRANLIARLEEGVEYARVELFPLSASTCPARSSLGAAAQSSVRPHAQAVAVFVARMLCSDPACAEEQEIVIAELTELDSACCECGFGLVVTAISQVALARPVT
jgi:hypothetical protein